jgi:single-stranded-DNA-specific exonuclease
LNQFLDLLVVSIACDIVPITGENRTLAFFGLKKLNTNPSVGFQALIQISNCNKKLDISSIVFTIGPRINAAGRIKHAGLAVKLLTSEDIDEAMHLAKKIENNNKERRSLDEATTEEILNELKEDVNQSLKSTVLFNKNWHKGIIGIVASRCIEHYYRPTIILTESQNMATGSARSVDGFDIYQAIEECSDLLVQFGGHPFAAGLSMEIEKVPEFKKRFDEVVRKTIPEDKLVPTLEVDHALQLDFINFKFFGILSQMEPFGPRNMNPVFQSDNCSVVYYPKLLKEKHLKFMVQQEGCSQYLEAIAFNMSHHYESLLSERSFKMVFTIEMNEYLGDEKLQLNVKDLKFD